MDFLEPSSISYAASIVTIISLIAAPIGYAIKLWLESVRASRNLSRELDDTLIALDDKKYYEDWWQRSYGGKTYRFMRRRLNHDFYDSMVFSGKINYLKPKLQQKVQDTFQKIKDHNNYLEKVNKVIDSAQKDEDYIYKLERYYEILEKTELDLLDEIPKRIEKLKLFSSFRRSWCTSYFTARSRCRNISSTSR